jgi:hypothetical protein
MRFRMPRCSDSFTPVSQRIVLPIPGSPERTSAVGTRSMSDRNDSIAAGSASRPMTRAGRHDVERIVAGGARECYTHTYRRGEWHSVNGCEIRARWRWRTVANADAEVGGRIGSVWWNERRVAPGGGCRAHLSRRRSRVRVPSLWYSPRSRLATCSRAGRLREASPRRGVHRLGRPIATT